MTCSGMGERNACVMLLRSITGFLMLLAWASLNCFGQDNLFDESHWKREGLVRATNSFVQTTRAPHPEDSKISAFHCERESRWWGDLIIVRHGGDAVSGFVPLPADYLEDAGHYVRYFYWREIREVGWVLHVFTSTHRCNGSLRLLDLKDGQMRSLMHTRAVAQYDERWFDHGQLQIEHLDGDASKPVMLRVHGTEHEVDQLGRQSEKKVEEHWFGDASKRQFVMQSESKESSK